MAASVAATSGGVVEAFEDHWWPGLPRAALAAVAVPSVAPSSSVAAAAVAASMAVAAAAPMAVVVAEAAAVGVAVGVAAMGSVVPGSVFDQRWRSLDWYEKRRSRFQRQKRCHRVS